MKTCSVCGQEFDKSATGRLRIAKKEVKGESIAWLCPSCAENVMSEEEK